MRVALAQINTSVGAVAQNAGRISRFLDDARAKGADLTVFPELALIGYPPQDLLDREGFVTGSLEVLKRLARDHKADDFILGFAEPGGKTGKGLFNSAAFVSGGKVEFTQSKRLLPTYDVFDERRYFDAGQKSRCVKIGGKSVGITICEDIWTEPEFLGRALYVQNPAEDLKKEGAELLVNISASPYHDGKQEVRERLTQKLSRAHHLPLIYVNLVGGDDELLFDGGSFAMDPSGKVIARARVFTEDLIVVDLDRGAGEMREWPDGTPAWQAEALIMGLRDYVRKCGFAKAVLGLSGGIDSALVVLLAVEALGARNVLAVSMPSQFTAPETRRDAEEMARKLNIGFLTIPIEPVTSAYENALASAFQGAPRDVTEENIQARVRGNLLMALSNKFGCLVLSTGNKSELAVGYCTQYGDMAGGLAVISDLPKGSVYEVTRHLNRKWNAIPESVFNRPPTAELRPDQKDEDSLPPYAILDPILQRYVEENACEDAIAKAGFDSAVVKRVARMVDRNEFKRKQAAPGLRLSRKAFGVGRRMPIARESV
ncbi:MAG: NAD+ synthase [Pseudomonadota bacterium]